MIFAFAECELDINRQELRRAGEIIHLEPQVFDLLILLIENRDRIVSKDEILDRVWEGRVVSEAALSSRINAARKAIGDDGNTQRVIRTFHKRGFRFVAELNDVTQVSETGNATASAPEKPSLAVLPFVNLSGTGEADYFVDGVVEEVITALSRVRWLVVIARTSSFTYKGRAISSEQIGQELGVSYLLSGSIRKFGRDVRIAAQLAEAATGRQVWAHRFDGDASNIFELQDRITEGVVAAIVPNVRIAEIERIRAKRTDDLNAYDLYLRALSESYSFSEQGLVRAESLLRRCVNIDPEFSDAWALLADCISRLYSGGWSRDVEKTRRECRDCVLRAVAADRRNGVALATAAWCFAIFAHEHTQALEFAAQALEQNPSSFHVHGSVGWAFMFSGELPAALLHFDEALRLSPVDIELYRPLVGKAATLFHMGSYHEAAQWAQRAVLLSPNHIPALRTLAAALARFGRLDEAAVTVALLRSIDPSSSVTDVRRNAGRFRDRSMLERYLAGLRLAGMPDPDR